MWVAKHHSPGALLGLHDQLWNPDEGEGQNWIPDTFGLLAVVKQPGVSFWDTIVRRRTGMSGAEALARRNRIANYLDSLGKDTTLLRQATTEHAQVVGIVDALGYTMAQLWNAME